MKTHLRVLLLSLLVVASCKKKEEIVPVGGSLPANYENQGTISVKNNKLKICIWDYSVIDGDIIDLYVNGKKILSNYELIEEKKCLEVQLADGENWIGVVAINEGSMGPASPHVQLDDGVSKQEFDIDGYINQPGGYTIQVVK